MNKLRWLIAGIAVGVIVVAFRDMERHAWITPPLPGRGSETDEEEPVLGYDGMDQETLFDWIAEADLDDDTIDRILDYERAHADREPVIEALEGLRG